MKRTHKKFSANFSINNGSYDEVLLVSVGTNFKELETYAKQHGFKDLHLLLDDSDKEPVCDGLFSDDYNILWIRNWTNKEYDYDVLRHECHHICQLLLAEKRGMSNELEALAYHQDYLIDTIRKEVRKRWGVYKDKLKSLN